MSMTTIRHQSESQRLALQPRFSRAEPKILSLIQPSKLSELLSLYQGPGGPEMRGVRGDPWQLKELAPYLHHLDCVRRRFGEELRRKPGKSALSQSRWEGLKNGIDATLAKCGGPFAKRDVRRRAFQIINPHRRWQSGITSGSWAQRVKLEDAIRWIPAYESTYGRDPYMTPAFAALIEAAKELRRLQTANPRSNGRQCRSTYEVLELLARFGFTTEKLSMAAKLMVTTPKITKSKPKRKTASIKKPEKTRSQREMSRG